MATTIRARLMRVFMIGGIVAATMVPAAAFGQEVGTYGGGSTPTGPDTGTEGSEQPAAQPTSDGGGSLPLTGGDIVGLALIGAGALAGGTVLVRSGRRRTAHS